MNRYFIKQNIQIVNKHKKRQSTLLLIGEMQIQIRVRSTTTHPLEWLKLKILTIQSIGEYVDLANHVLVILKTVCCTLNVHILPYDSGIPILDI